jgi:hypothetical protein
MAIHRSPKTPSKPSLYVARGLVEVLASDAPAPLRLTEAEACRRLLAYDGLLAACKAFLECPPKDRHDLHLEEIMEAAVAKAEAKE